MRKKRPRCLDFRSECLDFEIARSFLWPKVTEQSSLLGAEKKIELPRFTSKNLRNSNLKHRITKRLKVLLLSYKTCII